jgi:DNA-binding NarL/FixJ family response regulator
MGDRQNAGGAGDGRPAVPFRTVLAASPAAAPEASALMALHDTAVPATYVRAVRAPLSVAVVTEDDLLLQRVRVALDREGLVAHVDLAGRREPELDHLERLPDVVVLTGSSARRLAAAAHAVRRHVRDAHVVLVIGAHAECSPRHLLDAGVEAIVTENDLETTLPIAVRAVCAGQLSVPGGMRHAVELPALSHRERQILRLVAAGLTNEQIAARLYLAKSTVAGHLTAVFRRLGVRSRSEAVAMVLAGDESLRASILGAGRPERAA